MSKTLKFPKTAQELTAFEEKHKDYPYKGDPSKIDPEKIWNKVQGFMKVRISKDKLHGICLENGNVYEIYHNNHLARIAAKCAWFHVDNPQFTPDSIQDAVLLDCGKIKVKP
ncbi:hypothetical protein [Altibacter sp. HG106]|uniref:hypothetical protein n=1 Tax=Altibacter sp. HG106 TaxID=3023937 RepID=UPI00234FC2BA|nr:hypothetical protein [Altibacter sp. HG106]MDC7994444.1 hypothetical protein [Altibacter sp. HG106]